MIYSEPMANLQAALRQLAETFSRGILDAVRAASLEDLHESSAPVPQRRGRPRGSGKTATPTPAITKRGRPRKGNGALTTDVLLNAIVDALKKHPKGLRSEELRALLKVDKVPFRLVAKEAVAAGLATKTGEKRATTFFPR